MFWFKEKETSLTEFTITHGLVCTLEKSLDEIDSGYEQFSLNGVVSLTGCEEDDVC